MPAITPCLCPDGHGPPRRPEERVPNHRHPRTQRSPSHHFRQHPHRQTRHKGPTTTTHASQTPHHRRRPPPTGNNPRRRLGGQGSPAARKSNERARKGFESGKVGKWRESFLVSLTCILIRPRGGYSLPHQLGPKIEPWLGLGPHLQTRGGRGWVRLGWVGSRVVPKARVPRLVCPSLISTTGPVPSAVWPHNHLDC